MAENEISHIMGWIKQETFNFTFRFNYNISPDLSVQYYGNPIISSSKYNDFKQGNDPHSVILSEPYESLMDEEIYLMKLKIPITSMKVQ